MLPCNVTLASNVTHWGNLPRAARATRCGVERRRPFVDFTLFQFWHFCDSAHFIYLFSFILFIYLFMYLLLSKDYGYTRSIVVWLRMESRHYVDQCSVVFVCFYIAKKKLHCKAKIVIGIIKRVLPLCEGDMPSGNITCLGWTNCHITLTHGPHFCNMVWLLDR